MFRWAYMHTHIHIYTHASMHTYMHAYIHTYLHTHIHTCVFGLRVWGVFTHICLAFRLLDLGVEFEGCGTGFWA